MCLSGTCILTTIVIAKGEKRGEKGTGFHVSRRCRNLNWRDFGKGKIVVSYINIWLSCGF